jgi:hypothetical protein
MDQAAYKYALSQVPANLSTRACLSEPRIVLFSQGLEQCVTLNRLGAVTMMRMCPLNLSYRWLLDCCDADQELVAHALIKEALSDEMRNWWNLELSGLLLSVYGSCHLTANSSNA